MARKEEVLCQAEEPWWPGAEPTPWRLPEPLQSPLLEPEPGAKPRACAQRVRARIRRQEDALPPHPPRTTTADGRQILDGTAGLWCCNAGHAREPIIQAIQAQARDLDYAPSFQYGHPKVFAAAASGGA